MRPEAPDDALEAIGPDGALVIGGDEWVVTVGQVTVPLGSCYRVFFHPQVAEVQELKDGSRRVVFEPAGVHQAEQRSDSDWFQAVLSRPPKMGNTVASK